MSPLALPIHDVDHCLDDGDILLDAMETFRRSDEARTEALRHLRDLLRPCPLLPLPATNPITHQYDAPDVPPESSECVH